MAGNRAISHADLRQQVDLLGPAAACEKLSGLLESKQVTPHDFSVAELAEAFMGHEWVANLRPKSGRYYAPAELREADGSAIQYSHFSAITGQIFFSEVRQAFEIPDFVFSKVVPTKPTKIQDLEKIPMISHIGDEFFVVGENGLYPNFGVSQDWIEVAAKQKRGGIVPVTKEAILGDLTGSLLNQCRKLGEWLGLNKEKRIIDCIIDENGGAVSAALGGHRYHWKGTTYATYQTSTPWDNVTASAGLVDWTDLSEAWQTLVSITDPYTGEPFPQSPKHLVVTPQNLPIAWRILNATNVQTHSGGYAQSGNLQDYHAPSPLSAFIGGTLTLLSSPHLAARAATDTDWWLGDLSRAFAYFENWSVQTEEAPSNSEAAFHRDVVFQYKASEKGTAATLEPRVVTECRA